MSANVTVSECIESGEKGWRMSGECIESGERVGECLANVSSPGKVVGECWANVSSPTHFPKKSILASTRIRQIRQRVAIA